MFCIIATTFYMNAQPAKIEQLSPCYRTFELCTAAIPSVAHRMRHEVNTGMAFRCEKEERAI